MRSGGSRRQARTAGGVEKGGRALPARSSDEDGPAGWVGIDDSAYGSLRRVLGRLEDWGLPHSAPSFGGAGDERALTRRGEEVT